MDPPFSFGSQTCRGPDGKGRPTAFPFGYSLGCVRDHPFDYGYPLFLYHSCGSLNPAGPWVFTLDLYILALFEKPWVLEVAMVKTAPHPRGNRLGSANCPMGLLLNPIRRHDGAFALALAPWHILPQYGMWQSSGDRALRSFG